MQLNNLIQGRFIKRYKRFFVDVLLASGEVVTAHSNNTGSMRSLLEEGNVVWLEHVNNPKRKLQYTLHLIQLASGAVVSVNTLFPNKLVFEAIQSGQLNSFYPYDALKREVVYGSENSRIDIFLEQGRKKTFIEIKNVTLMEEALPQVAQFPDAATTRGQKHLRELIAERQKGNRAVMFYLIGRTDCTAFKTADHIDPAYATLVQEAVTQGVEVMPVGIHVEFMESVATLSLTSTVDFIP